MHKFRGKLCKCISWKLLFTVLVEELQREKALMFSVLLCYICISLNINF